MSDTTTGVLFTQKSGVKAGIIAMPGGESSYLYFISPELARQAENELSELVVAEVLIEFHEVNKITEIINALYQLRVQVANQKKQCAS